MGSYNYSPDSLHEIGDSYKKRTACRWPWLSAPGKAALIHTMGWFSDVGFSALTALTPDLDAVLMSAAVARTGMTGSWRPVSGPGCHGGEDWPRQDYGVTGYLRITTPEPPSPPNLPVITGSFVLAAPPPPEPVLAVASPPSALAGALPPPLPPPALPVPGLPLERLGPTPLLRDPPPPPA
jgi:hypothetical protein